MLQFSFPPPQSHVLLGLRVLVGPEPWRPRMILIHLLCSIPYLKRSSSRYVQRTIPGNNDQIAGQLRPYAPKIFAVRYFEDPDCASAAPNIDSRTLFPGSIVFLPFSSGVQAIVDSWLPRFV